MYGLLGKSLSHSFSVTVHKMLNNNIDYRLFETDNVGDFLKTRSFEGLNVTNPYKRAVIPYLDALAGSAEKTGTVNTIVNDNGTLTGHNTDYLALLNLIDKHFPDDRKSKVSILGNGATMRSIKKALEASGFVDIAVYARNPKANEHPLSTLDIDTEILIQTTPVGMFPSNHDRLPVNPADLKRLIFVFDVIYNPFKTHLLLECEALDIPFLNGLPFLFEQAALSQLLFYGKEEPPTTEPQLKAFERQYLNICLIGLPFSGKSHYAKRLAGTLNREFADTDALVEQKAGKKIETIFADHGEAYFRELEKSVVLEIAKKHGQVIATGGGVVKDLNAIRALKQNAVIVHLDLDTGLIDENKIRKRPLVQSLDDLAALKEKREVLYKTHADVTIRKDTMDETVISKRIKEALDAYFSD